MEAFYFYKLMVVGVLLLTVCFYSSSRNRQNFTHLSIKTLEGLNYKSRTSDSEAHIL